MSQCLLQRASHSTQQIVHTSHHPGSFYTKAVQQMSKYHVRKVPLDKLVLSEADLAEGGPKAEAHGAPSHDMEGAPQHAGCVPYRHQLCSIWDACDCPAPGFSECIKDVYSACERQVQGAHFISHALITCRVCTSWSATCTTALACKICWSTAVHVILLLEYALFRQSIVELTEEL